jgi:hypothetical protein
MRLLAAVTVAVALVSGCSSGASETNTKSAAEKPAAVSVDSPKALAEKLGCADTFKMDETEELGVEQVGRCEVDGQEVRLLTFANDSARDQFTEIAEQYGERSYVPGEKFLVEVDTAELETAVKSKLG